MQTLRNLTGVRLRRVQEPQAKGHKIDAKRVTHVFVFLCGVSVDGILFFEYETTSKRKVFEASCHQLSFELQLLSLHH